MKARTRNFIILCSLLSLAAQPSDAQVKRRQKPKPAQKQNALAVADFYPSAAKLMVIDSVVVDKEKLRKAYSAQKRIRTDREIYRHLQFCHADKPYIISIPQRIR